MAYYRRPKSNSGNPGNQNEKLPSAATDTSDIHFRDAIEGTDEQPLASLDSFVVPARDERGGTVHTNFFMPPYLERQMLIAVKSDRFPYLNQGDLIRHAVHRHLRWLTDIRKTLDPHISQVLEAMAEASRDYDYQTRSREVFEHIDRQVDQAITRGHTHEAVRLLAMMKSRIDTAQLSPRQEEVRRLTIERYSQVLHSSGLVTGSGRKQ